MKRESSWEMHGWTRVRGSAELFRQRLVNGQLYCIYVQTNGPPYRWELKRANGAELTLVVAGTESKLRRAKLFRSTIPRSRSTNWRIVGSVGELALRKESFPFLQFVEPEEFKKMLEEEKL